MMESRSSQARVTMHSGHAEPAYMTQHAPPLSLAVAGQQQQHVVHSTCQHCVAPPPAYPSPYSDVGHSAVPVYTPTTEMVCHHTPPPVPPRPHALRRHSLPGHPGSPIHGPAVHSAIHSAGHNSPVPHSNPYLDPNRPRRKLYFYNRHDPHYGFTNFSPHAVVYQGRRYPTSEHLFQHFKFIYRPELAEHIRTFSEQPSAALSEARRFAPEVREDWMQVNIPMMDETLWHKFTQHRSLMEELLATGDDELIEDSDKDSFWGVGKDRRGRNELGKALERLRSKLRDRR